MGQLLGPACRGHSCSPAATKTLPCKPNIPSMPKQLPIQSFWDTNILTEKSVIELLIELLARDYFISLTNQDSLLSNLPLLSTINILPCLTPAIAYSLLTLHNLCWLLRSTLGAGQSNSYFILAENAAQVASGTDCLPAYAACFSFFEKISHRTQLVAV